MKKRLVVMLFATFAFGFLAVACATPPTEEMNAAHDAVIRAENNANAVTYASNTLIRARDALTRMQSEADARRFDAALNFSAEAISLADRAIAEGNAAAALAREEAAHLLDSLGVPLAQTTDAFNAAEQARVLDLDYDALALDLLTARENYYNAQRNFEENNYRDAIIQGQNARVILSDINADMNRAAQLAVRK
jgi:hypothetical protein